MTGLVILAPPRMAMPAPPQPAPEHVARRRGQTQSDDDLPRAEENDQARDIGGEVDGLALAVRRTHVLLCQQREGDDEKRPRSGTVKAVVDADDKGRRRGDQRRASRGLRRSSALRQRVLSQDEQGRQGKNDIKHLHQHRAVHHQGQMRAAPCADQRRGHARQRHVPVDIALSRETGGRKGGAAGGGELVRGDGIVGREAGEQIRRQGDQSPAPADGVHKPGQQHKGTYDQKGFEFRYHEFSERRQEACSVLV